MVKEKIIENIEELDSYKKLMISDKRMLVVYGLFLHVWDDEEISEGPVRLVSSLKENEIKVILSEPPSFFANTRAEVIKFIDDYFISNNSTFFAIRSVLGSNNTLYDTLTQFYDDIYDIRDFEHSYLSYVKSFKFEREAEKRHPDVRLLLTEEEYNQLGDIATKFSNMNYENSSSMDGKKRKGNPKLDHKYHYDDDLDLISSDEPHPIQPSIQDIGVAGTTGDPGNHPIWLDEPDMDFAEQEHNNATGTATAHYDYTPLTGGNIWSTNYYDPSGNKYEVRTRIKEEESKKLSVKEVMERKAKIEELYKQAIEEFFTDERLSYRIPRISNQFDRLFEEMVYDRFFKNDDLGKNVFYTKYADSGKNNSLIQTPSSMFKIMAVQFADIEAKYKSENALSASKIFSLLNGFKYLIPGGSVIYGMNNYKSLTSLSNCFVVGNKDDSYGGILLTEQEQVHIMKRRGGVGHDLSHIRPIGSTVNNAAITSSGIVPFMERYSNSTREVAQDGRRGALMLSIDASHQNIRDFINAKQDLTKITGANISVKVRDFDMESNVIKHIAVAAHKTAEPGILFWDTILRESPADCYADEGFETISTNPCKHCYKLAS